MAGDPDNYQKEKQQIKERIYRSALRLGFPDAVLKME